MAEQNSSSFWTVLGDSFTQGVGGLSDTIGAGLQTLAREKIAQEVARHGGQSNLRAESIITSESPLPPSGEVKANYEQAAAAASGAIDLGTLAMVAAIVGVSFLAVRSRQ